jgi:hypothetical protein
VREHQHVAVLQVGRDVLGVHLAVRRVREHAHDHIGLADGVRGIEDAEPYLLGLRAARRSGSEADPHVEPAVLQVLGVRVPLRPVPEDRDLLVGQYAGVGVLLVVDRGHRRSSFR